MKKLVLLFLAILISVSFSFSQSPQAFKYQSVVRDATGEILDNQLVSFRIGIRDVSAVGTLLYQETFSLTTTQFGLATFEIGNGTPEPGSGLFADIDWGTNSKYLELELDPDGGIAYSPMGTSQILSTPYALYAEEVGNSDDGDWSILGDNIYSAIPGNVGIGVQYPVTPLHVHGRGAFGNTVNSTKANRALNLISTSAVMRIWRTTDNTSFDPGVELIWGTQPTQGDEGNFWWDFFIKGSDGSFNIRDRSFGQGNETRLAIAPTGYVGLGTTTPNERLHVAGALVIEEMVSGSLSDSLVLWDPIDSKLKVMSLSGLMGDNDWTLDGDTLYSGADSTVTIKNGNVGIGTTNPDAPFVIMDGTDTLFKVVDGQIRIPGGGPTEGIAFMGDYAKNGEGTVNIANGLFRPAPNTQALATGSLERLRITPTGDIGIGTPTPVERLDVDGGLRIGFSANNNAGTIRWTGTEMEYNDGTQWNPFGISSSPLWAENGPDIFNTNTGLVGIGTMTPAFTLDIRGNDPDDGGVLQIANSDESHLLRFFSGRLNDPNPFILWQDGDPLRFATSAGGFTEQMRIDVNGNVGIGTDAPTQMLDVNGKLRVRELLLHNGLNSVLVADSEGVLHVRDVTTISGGGPWVESGSDIYSINAGNVGIGTSTPTHALDVMGEARIEVMSQNDFLDNIVVADAQGVLHIREAFTLGGPGKNIKDVLRLEPRSTYPQNPEEGDIFVNANDHNIYCYLNGEWKQLNN